MSHLPSSELERFVRELRAERWAMLRELAAQAAAERSLSAVQHDEPMDRAERGTDLQLIELTEQISDRTARRFEALNHALERAAQGRLGICEQCGDSIPLARLYALPGVEVCLACAEEAERSARAHASAPPRSPRMPAEPEDPRAVLPGRAVYSPGGEGVVLRIAPFGTCGACGEVEGRYDSERDEVRCTSEGCELPLSDAEDLGVVQVQDETITAHLQELHPVNLAPYD